MGPPGLLYAASRPKNPDLDDATFNKWYNEVHLGDVLAPKGGPDLALRYKHVTPDAADVKFAYLTVYRLPDLDFATGGGMKQVPTTSDMLPGSHDLFQEIDLDVRFYEKIHEFEGKRNIEGRARAIVTVAITPASGTEDDVEAWYKQEHLSMLSDIPTFRRSTRYKLAGPLDKDLPAYLAIHEYDDENIPGDMIERARATEWSKRVASGATKWERGVWTYVFEKSNEGAEGGKL